METIPISAVSPDVVSLRDPNREPKAIRAVVTLIWPFSSRTSSLSLLLAEHDARLRGSRGQVRVTFQNGAARALAKEHVQIGDEILLSLSGCIFNKSVHSPVGDQNETMSFETVGGVRTPGKCVNWDLLYGSRLSAKVIRNGVGVADLNIHQQEPGSPRETILSDPFSSVNHVSTIHHDLWGSPAFLKKLRHPHQRYSLPDFDVDSVDDFGSPSSKRRKLSYNREFWRYVERSPSPRKDTGEADTGEADGEGNDRSKEVFISNSPIARRPKPPSRDLRKDKLPSHPMQSLALRSEFPMGASSGISQSENQMQIELQQVDDEISVGDFTVTENDAEETLPRLTPEIRDVSVEDILSGNQQSKETPADSLPDNLDSSKQMQPDLPTVRSSPLDFFTDTGTAMSPPKLTIPNVDPIPELGQSPNVPKYGAPAKPRLEPVPSPSLPLPSPFPREQENSTSYFDHVDHDSQRWHQTHQERVVSPGLAEPLQSENQLPDQNQGDQVSSPSATHQIPGKSPTKDILSQLPSSTVVDFSSPTADLYETIPHKAAADGLKVLEDDVLLERQDGVQKAQASKDEPTPLSLSAQQDPLNDKSDPSTSERSFRRETLLVESDVPQAFDTPTKPKLSPLTPKNRQRDQNLETPTPHLHVIKDSEDDYDSQSISTVIPSSPSRQKSSPWVPPDDLFAIPDGKSTPEPPEVLEGEEEDLNQFLASDDFFAFRESEQRETPQSSLSEAALREPSESSNLERLDSQRVQTHKAQTTSSQIPEFPDIPDHPTRSQSKPSAVVDFELQQTPISSSRPVTPEKSHRSLDQRVTDLSLHPENQDSHLLTPIASQRVRKPPTVSSPTSLAQSSKEPSDDTVPMTPIATQQTDVVSEGDTTPKAMDQQMNTMTESMKTRKRHSDVPRILSPWFTDGWRRSSEETAQLGTELQDAQIQIKSPPPSQPSLSQRSDASLGLRTSHSYYTPLSGLRPCLNLPINGLGKHLVDVLAVVMRDSRKPLRASSGPRDWNTVFGITDQFMNSADENDDGLVDATGSDSVQRSIQVVIHRPTKNSLPVARKGDVILLRSFTVISNKGACQLLSTDGSAWAVWSLHTGRDAVNGIVKPQMKGPPVEFGLGELKEVDALRHWWQQD